MIHFLPGSKGEHFNPRFPWGKRQLLDIRCDSGYRFQSTLPVGEATSQLTMAITATKFQSTLPVGEATRLFAYLMGQRKNFNPRFPWGKRLALNGYSAPFTHFNPRFPWGKRPSQLDRNFHIQVISIHASRGGSDTAFHRFETPD